MNNNDRGYNLGKHLFASRNLLERNRSSAINILAQSVINRATRSPWDSLRSGYSSSSPPGTNSSGSSPSSANSQSYGRSPERVSVETIISGLNDEASGTNFPPRRESPPAAGTSNGTHSAPIRCSRDCIDPLCENCLALREGDRSLVLRPTPSRRYVDPWRSFQLMQHYQEQLQRQQELEQQELQQQELQQQQLQQQQLQQQQLQQQQLQQQRQQHHVSQVFQQQHLYPSHLAQHDRQQMEHLNRLNQHPLDPRQSPIHHRQLHHLHNPQQYHRYQQQRWQQYLQYYQQQYQHPRPGSSQGSSHGSSQGSDHRTPSAALSRIPLIAHELRRTQQLSCHIHIDSLILYCQTCSRAYCSDCGVNNHRGHVTMFLKEAVEIAGAQANQVLIEAHQGIRALRDEIDAVQAATEELEQKSREAVANVLFCVERILSALEIREKQLLDGIERARRLKSNALRARDEGLHSAIARLAQSIQELTEAVDASAFVPNPFDLTLSKDAISAEIHQIRLSCRQLVAPEENWISFAGSEATVINAIASLGAIMMNNPGPIGDRRAVRGRGNSPQPIARPTQRRSPPCSLIPVPRGRPIPVNAYPVTVRNGRNCLCPSPKPVKIIGDDGDARDNLCRPWGITCDRDGHIIVADRSNNRIQIYREDGSLVRRFGSHGSGPGEFDRPAGIAVDGRRRIIVADKDNHRIQIVTMDGKFLLAFGDKGSRCGQFNYPWDVAVNSECEIVVSDTRNHRIQLFSAEGVFLRKYGFETSSSLWKHFDSPRGVCFNPAGNVVVTDFNNHRVLIVDNDFVNAKILGCEINGGAKQFLRPQGVIVDDEGNIIVADSRNHRVQVFDAAGSLKWKFGSHGKAADEMDRPSGIALTPSGKIVLVDFGNNRVLMI